MNPNRRYVAELIGTFWLVLGGCGSAIFSASFPGLGIGYLGVALAFGLSVVTAAYALGHVSGGHFNPAVTLGVAASGQFPRRDIIPYVISQLLGATLAAAALYAIASGSPSFDLQAGFASNGYGARSPGGFGLGAALLTELLTSALFVFLILEVTSQAALKGFAPLSIGLSLALIHLITIPVTGTSVNPARSTGPALFAGGGALSQLWLFWLAPILGGGMAGLAYRWFERGHMAKTAVPPDEIRPLKRAASR